jgi:hypothetical protein
MKKSDCTKMAEFCHNTRNRVTLKMCDYTGEECEVLREYHQVLLVTECLCNYAACCYCERDDITGNVKKELDMRCGELKRACEQIHKLVPAEKEYLNCGKIKSMCGRNKKKSSRK